MLPTETKDNQPELQKNEEVENAEEVEEEEETDDEEEEEPRLKYTRLTRTLGGVYRNGDAVASSAVFGERMVCLTACSLCYMCMLVVADMKRIVDSRNT